VNGPIRPGPGMMADCTRGRGGTIATVTEAKTDAR